MNTNTLKTIALATVAGITVGIASVGFSEDRAGAGIGGGSGAAGSDIVVNGGTINARGGGVGDVSKQVATNIATQVVNDNKQMIFDMVHPVNSFWIQYADCDNPTVLFNGNGIASTWDDVTANYAGRYFKADTSVGAGSAQAESLPKPAIAAEKAHTHGPGNLDVVSSYFGLARNNAIYDRNKAGAFSFSKGGDQSQTYQDVELNGKKSYYVYNVNLSLGSNWNTSTKTGSGSSHTHTVNASGPYADGAAVKPLTSTIKIWKRVK